MSRDSAKAHFDRSPLDPPDAWITDTDMKAFTDTVYDDIAAAVAAGSGGTQMVPANVPLAFKGVVANTAALPATGTDGDVVVTGDDGHIHVWHGGAFNNIGPTTAQASGGPDQAAFDALVQRVTTLEGRPVVTGLPDTTNADDGAVLMVVGTNPKVVEWRDNLDSQGHQIDALRTDVNNLKTATANLPKPPAPPLPYWVQPADKTAVEPAKGSQEMVVLHNAQAAWDDTANRLLLSYDFGNELGDGVPFPTLEPELLKDATVFTVVQGATRVVCTTTSVGTGGTGYNPMRPGTGVPLIAHIKVLSGTFADIVPTDHIHITLGASLEDRVVMLEHDMTRVKRWLGDLNTLVDGLGQHESVADILTRMSAEIQSLKAGSP